MGVCPFGAIGVVWCVAFARWFRNRPEENPRSMPPNATLSAAGSARGEPAHARVPWGDCSRSGNFGQCASCIFCMSYGWYFNLQYLPAYLEDAFGVAEGTVSGGRIAKGGPLILGAAGCLLGGWLTDSFTAPDRQSPLGTAQSSA